MSKRLKSTLILITMLMSSVLFPVFTYAKPFETRTYLDLSVIWPVSKKTGSHIKLGPFVREESRFRKSGLHYVKSFIGMRTSFLPWFRIAAYYAHKDFPKSSKPQAHMAVLDAFFDVNAGPVVFTDKNGLEVHITDGFFRYRNALVVRYKTPLHWFDLFAKEEFRVDSDAARVNMLDFWSGILMRFFQKQKAKLSLKIFYGYETKRRNKPTWQGGVHLLGIELKAKL